MCSSGAHGSGGIAQQLMEVVVVVDIGKELHILEVWIFVNSNSWLMALEGSFFHFDDLGDFVGVQKPFRILFVMFLLLCYLEAH